MSRPPPSLLPIERPRCSRYLTRMTLAQVKDLPDHKEKRTFECPKCNFVDTVVVADPLESRAAGWLSGELGHQDSATDRS